MKKLLVFGLLLGPLVPAMAGPYFRPLDPAHIHQSAGFLLDPNDLRNSEGVTDVALITHSTQDGSIVPAAWQSILPPEDWAPLEIGAGGNLRGNAILHIGTSANVAPQLLGIFLGKVDGNSSALAQGIKAAVEGQGESRVRLGYGLCGNAIQGGVFQSAKEMFPGAGLFGILKKASRISVGYAWAW